MGTNSIPQALHTLNIALLFQRYGPYHAARARALAGLTRSVIPIEVSAADDEYAWQTLSDRECSRVHLLGQASESEASVARLAARLREVLTNHRVDVMAVPGWATRSAVTALACCASMGIPVVMMLDSTRADARRTWSMEAVKRRVLRSCGAALVSGTRSAEYAWELGFPRDRIFQGFDVVDNDHFSTESRRIRADEPGWRRALALPERYFLASGRFVAKKNMQGLLRAYARYLELSSDPWNLVLLGDGPLRPHIESKINALGIQSKVVRAGFRQYPELPAHYALAGAFVLPSIVDQWGLVVNEAMASGLPVLVSERCGCAPDLVSNGENGYTFDPYDAEQLADLMARVSSDGCDRRAMGEASRRIIGRWTPRTFARNLLSAAEAAVGAEKARPGPVDRGLLWALARR